MSVTGLNSYKITRSYELLITRRLQKLVQYCTEHHTKYQPANLRSVIIIENTVKYKTAGTPTTGPPRLED